MVDVVGRYVPNAREEERKRGREGEGERQEGDVSCPMISCHINSFDLLIIGEYHAAEVGASLQCEF